MLPWLLVTLACTEELPDPPPRPDVLLVVLDTVRADHLSAYGHTRATSPQFDAIAASGVLFEDVTAPASWTWPSHASLFTGTAPWTHGAHFVEGDTGLPLSGGHLHAAPMREDLETLAEAFAAAGYRTASLSANQLLAPELGLTRGFEVAETFADDSDILPRARALLRQDDEPLFLFVNFYGAHAPWFITEATRPLAAQLHPQAGQEWVLPYVIADGGGVHVHQKPSPGQPSAFEAYVSGELEIPPDGKRLIRRLYDGELRRVDQMLNQLLKAWNASGRGAGVVAVTSDHGEYLGERGLLAHCRTLYPEVLRIPLVLAAPGRLPAGVRVETPVQLQDLHPTLLELAGLAPRPRPEADSLVPLASDPDAPLNAPIKAAAWRDPNLAKRVGGRFEQGYRLFRDADEALILGMTGGEEYYALAEDPGMNQDLAAQRPERVEALRAEAARGYPEAETSGPVEVSAETLEVLRAMGYIDG
ncbi:MAG: sulfatase [Alphaproteobacteria bacterium]|nr:sulfatase [Alphaproteobacteria bacterium]